MELKDRHVVAIVYSLVEQLKVETSKYLSEDIKEALEITNEELAKRINKKVW